MSAILDNWKAGRGLPGVLVIDGHVHFNGGIIGPAWDAVPQAAGYARRAMDASGVDAACILGGGFYGPGNDYTRGNDDLLEFCRCAPDRFIGFAHFNPNDSQAALDAEMKRALRMGFRCIKLINSYQQNHPGDGPPMKRIYRFAAQHNMLIVNHYWRPEVLARVAREFSSVNFIAGHWFSNDALHLPNVYCCMWSLLSAGELTRGVKKYGAEKFVFGSDAFLNPISVGIGPIVHADISDDDKRKMLGLNQARLLHAAGALPRPLQKWLGIQPERGGRQRTRTARRRAGYTCRHN